MRKGKSYLAFRKNILQALKAIEAHQYAKVKNKAKISIILGIILQANFPVSEKMSLSKARFSINDIDDIIDTVRIIELYFHRLVKKT